MKGLEKAMFAPDRLALFLLANGLKPATTVTLMAEHSYLNGVGTKKNRSRKGVEYSRYNINSDFVREFRNQLLESGLPFTEEVWTGGSYLSRDGVKTSQKIEHNKIFNVGSNDQNLKRLISAKNGKELGLALGYPEIAVNSFGEIIEGEERNYQYILVSLAKAREEGVAFPRWLPFLLYMPEQLDLVNGIVSSTAEALGKTNMYFVRERNPELAREVEEEYWGRPLPDSWEIGPHGEYVCKFDSQYVEAH